MRADRIRWMLQALAVSAGLALLSSGGALAVGEGKTCRGVAGVRCDTGLVCDSHPGMCNVVDSQGTCVRVPEVCPLIYQPVCGCNGKTYGNDCQRRHAKVDKDRDGPCK